jgi:hypothetical protein
LLEQIRDKDRNGLYRDREAPRLKEDSLRTSPRIPLFKETEIREKKERREEDIFKLQMEEEQRRRQIDLQLMVVLEKISKKLE